MGITIITGKKHSDGDKVREVIELGGGQWSGFERMAKRDNDRLEIIDGEVYVRTGERNSRGNPIFRYVGNEKKERE